MTDWPKVTCRSCGTGEVKNQYPQSQWCDDCTAELRLLEKQDYYNWRKEANAEWQLKHQEKK